MIDIKNLKVSVEDKEIIKGLNLKINKGEVHAIMGPNGSGKSTLVDILIGILKPKSGSIKIDGEDVDIYNNKNWISKFGYLSQSFYIIGGSISENVAYGITKERIKNKAMFYFSFNDIYLKLTIW